MDRREMIVAVAGGVVAAAVASPEVAAQEQIAAKPGLRAVWKWHEPTKEWVRCRMDTIKPGDRFSMEEEIGSRERFVGVAKSHPKYVDGHCGITAEGETITV